MNDSKKNGLPSVVYEAYFNSFLVPVNGKSCAGWLFRATLVQSFDGLAGRPILNYFINRDAARSVVFSMNATPEPTLFDLQRRFGAIPFSRICQSPPLGTATEEDVIAIPDSDRRIFELVDGILVEKEMGSSESEIAVALIAILHRFIKPRNLGKILGEGGMFRTMPGLIRVPDVSYLSNERYQATEGIEINGFGPSFRVSQSRSSRKGIRKRKWTINSLNVSNGDFNRLGTSIRFLKR